VLNAAHQSGLKIPDALSLIGFDDMPLAELLQPPLTTIRQSARQLGGEGTRVLLKVIAGAKFESMETRLPVKLISRDSVQKLQPEPQTAKKAR
jgi:LacI family transcriptional regulator, galactose operon repressor